MKNQLRKFDGDIQRVRCKVGRYGVDVAEKRTPKLKIRMIHLGSIVEQENAKIILAY